MLSRVESSGRPRRAGEWILRILAFVMLAVLFYRVFMPRASSEAPEHASSSSLEASLATWTRSNVHGAVVTLDSAPSPMQRDWLSAVSRAGTRLYWSGASIVPSGISVTRAADPEGAWNVVGAAPSQQSVVLGDASAPLDTTRAENGEIRELVRGFADHLALRAAGSVATTHAADSVLFKRILVEGAAGWETKFTIAALAERGWNVDAIAHVAPGVDVRTGAPSRPDTSRYAAIIAVDTSASLIASSASDFVRQGGGLVAFRDAASIGPAARDDVVLEHRADGDVRAYRFGSGRVLRVGYKDLWRRRMAEIDTVVDQRQDPPAAHRELIARLVAAVAYAPRVALTAAATDDPAPYASLVDALGSPSVPRSRNGAAGSRSIPTSMLFALLVFALLGEWASRRLRGAR